MYFSADRNTPRWLVFLLDLVICVFSLFFAYLIRFDFFRIPVDEELPVLLKAFPIFILIRALTLYFGKTYAGIIRYTSTQDAKRIFGVVLLGSLLFGILSPVRFYWVDGFNFLPISIIILDYFLTNFFLITSRIAVKLIYFEQVKSKKDLKNVIVFGVGEAAILTKRTLDRELKTKHKMLAFIDPASKKIGKMVERVPIVGLDEIENILATKKIDLFIFSEEEVRREDRRKVVDLCLEQKIKVLNVPPINEWIGNSLSFKQIKEVRIEDLLGRDEIQLDTNRIKDALENEVVLVTGAAGSIGSEIVRQLMKFNVKKVVLFDQAESDLHEIRLELERKHKTQDIFVAIGDIRDQKRVNEIFLSEKPTIVFHAAAYKHVPLMEENPSEAIKTNVLGTKNLVDLSGNFKVKNFVFISTDKAVKPTSVMGASKRIAEMYVQASDVVFSGTKFITTRFGNVLGSNGSVIPLFKKQIEVGGPVTVTHEEITRFFMTIPEACQLVLEAGAMGKGGEIFIFDMGKSIKIIDLARKMIKLSGLEEGKDVQIKITGLRPGEKLYEELLNVDENNLPTHNSKILIAKISPENYEVLLNRINDLNKLSLCNEQDKMVSLMKAIVPEYISNNSTFSELDFKNKEITG